MSNKYVQLGEADKEKVLSYIAYEPEMNIFFKGDIEQFGMSEPVSVYALEKEDGSWDSVILRFYANAVCYSQDPLFDAHTMAEFVRESFDGGVISSINGKYEVIEALSPYFPELELREQNLAFLDYVYEQDIAPVPKGVEIRRLSDEDDYDEMFKLLGSIPEYDGLYDDEVQIEVAKQQRITNEAHGCVSYGAFYKGKLVSCASTSASSTEMAMIVGVGTKEDFRGFGLATSVVAEICRTELADGKKFLTIFYDNEQAGRIYRRIGFGPVGAYGMLR